MNLSLTDQHQCKYGNAKSGDLLDAYFPLFPFCSRYSPYVIGSFDAQDPKLRTLMVFGG